MREPLAATIQQHRKNKMIKKRIKTFKGYLNIIDNLTKAKHDIILYRGQTENYPLLPSIARKNNKTDTTILEQEMLNELKRRTQLKIKTTLNDDWEWLVYAQHFGMKTRLLDWTSNPLTALWFACSNEKKLDIDSFVYILTADKSYLIDTTAKINTTTKETPFNRIYTRILKPALNNERIIAQSGWFTAHKFTPKWGEFIKLEELIGISDKIIQIRIPANIKKDVIEQLSIFGINSQVLFPDITGICNHLNWKYIDK